MDINDLRVLVTVLSFIAFIGICIWAFSSRRRKTFERAARLPLEEDEPAAGKPPANEETPR